MDLFAPIVCVFSGATGSLIGSVGGLLGVGARQKSDDRIKQQL